MSTFKRMSLKLIFSFHQKLSPSSASQVEGRKKNIKCALCGGGMFVELLASSSTVEILHINGHFLVTTF